MNNTQLKIAGVGCGGRTLTYFKECQKFPEHYRLVAAADPHPERLAKAEEIADNPHFQTFTSAEELLKEEKLSDVLIIGTQDAFHADQAVAAMEIGYDLLLEKPIACRLEEVLRVYAAAERYGRRVMVCYVLRYTPFYRKIKELVDSGAIGRIINIDAREGVGTWHQAHSYVRGNWAVEADSSPMLLAKSSHDLDLISWFAESPCNSLSSHGSLEWFHSENKPKASPQFCSDGCPVESECPYSSLRYTRDFKNWSFVGNLGNDSSTGEIMNWLKHSPYDRCVYSCDNDVVDHQVVSLSFENRITANFTMTAFDHGRSLILAGTLGVLRAGETLKKDTGFDIIVQLHEGERQCYKVEYDEGMYGGHMGGDFGIIQALHQEMTCPQEQMETSLVQSIESHLIAFAAEESRHSRQAMNPQTLLGPNPVSAT